MNNNFRKLKSEFNEKLEKLGGELVGFMLETYSPITKKEAIEEFQRGMFIQLLKDLKLEPSENELIKLLEYILSINFEERLIRFQYKEYDGVWSFSLPLENSHQNTLIP